MRFGRGGRGRRWRLRLPASLRVRRVPLAVLGGILVVLVIATAREALEPGPWQRVLATREGLTGRRLATGGIIQTGDRFVALPHPSALRRDVEIRYNGRALVVPVLDVGPWNVDDDYWSCGQRPAAERGRGAYRTPVNRSGIDLSDATFATLGMRGNDVVEWRFVHRGYIPLPRLALRVDDTVGYAPPPPPRNRRSTSGSDVPATRRPIRAK
jgi:hypothetical protein